ncbi:translocation/assembly module TamB [Entomomonas moraniae]|uniref:Translocation/assembly module TamB n=1 Tax=Entomomonas moraniae TaxID=2213226 RepID=A0A3Q9JKZ8_9GAMM|nr:translocation/assembly module TamB domain-containing protein [Entomomonas moraniae]AZS49957.1 translocation/assembly module TamB [Entomomonas moraniae]
MKLTLKIAKYALIVIILVLLLILMTLILAIKTEAGSRYLLNSIPNLSVKNSQGTLSGGWSAEELIWQSEEIKITVQNPSLNWFASCLLTGNVCISQLKVKQLDIDLLDSVNSETNAKEQNKTATRLPTLNTPVTINIETVILEKLLIDKQEILSQALLKGASWKNTHVTIGQLTLHNGQAKANATLQGHIEFANNWPLEVKSQIELNELYQTPWLLALNVKGDLQKKLLLETASTGYLDANLQASACVLEENLPATLSLTINNFIPNNIIELPDTLLIKQLILNATGDLKHGYTVSTNSTFAGKTTPVYLTLNSFITTKQIDVKNLILKTTEQQVVNIKGNASFQPNLTADATLNYHNFPWQELYPLDPPPPIDLQTANIKLNYQNDMYRAQLGADLTGPAGNFELQTKITGDLKHLTLETLQIDTPDKGNINGTAALDFTPKLHWLASLNLKNINPNYWLKDLTGSLSGVVQSTGTIGDTIETDSKANIQGILNKQATQIKATVLAKQNQWHVPELLIKVGNNTITGQGELSRSLKANVNINLPNLKQLLPTLTGNVIGKVELLGSLEKPQTTVSLTGKRLSFEEQKINGIQLNANLNAMQQAQIKLQASHISSGTTSLGNLNLTASGDIKQQQLSLDISGGILTLSTQIDSKQDIKQNWLASINKLQVDAKGQNWQLQNKTRLNYAHTGELTLSAHCFKNGQATLCAKDQQTLLPHPKINYQLANFAMQSLQPWYPETFNWKSTLSADITLKILEQGMSGIIEIKTNAGVFQLQESTEEQWYDFPYQALNVLVNLTPNKITSTLEFKSTTLGNIHTQIILNPLANNKPIEGDFSIDGFDIGILRPFIPDVSELSGKIDGKGTISGILEKPYVSGKVTLKNGTVMGDISVSLENLQATAMIEGESLTIDGSWSSGKQGHAKITGDANWSNGINLNLGLKASKLPIIIAPYANLEANTDLKLKIDNNALSVAGVVNIPTGSIVVRELPPSTVTVSSDAIIVTQKAPEQTMPMKIDMDVKVLIGQEHLSFKGFGLTSTITGNLSITKNLFTQGEINLKNGVYRAYGQQLNITRANILFTGSMTEPSLDIEAVRMVDNVTAGVKVTGFTSQPKITVFSTPSMSQDQALSYIIFGRPLGAGDNNVLAQAALAMGVASTSETVGELASKVGLEDFQLDASGSGDDTSLTASGKINDKLSIHYGVSIFKAVNTIMLRYKLTKSIYLEAAGGTASSLDIFYKKSFK